jgi:hypothetical protein
MNLEDIAGKIGALLYIDQVAPVPEISQVYAGDKMSDLLAGAGPETLLVTNLTHSQLFKMSDIMEVPAVCLVNGAPIERVLIDAALKRGTAVMISSYDLYETCGRIFSIFRESRRAP